MNLLAISLVLSGHLSSSPAFYLEAVDGQFCGQGFGEIARHLAAMRPEKRLKRWKLYVRENRLFFRPNQMKKFEALSREAGVL